MQTRAFRVPLRVRLEYWLADKRWLKRGVQFSSVLVVAVGIIWLLSQLIIRQFPSVIPLFSDPGFVGLFGALFGAILGAVAGGLISLDAQLQEFQAKALIRKKKEIYEPLYDDLVNARDSLRRLPYSRGYDTYLRQARWINVPRFEEWVKIKGDSRFLEVPSWISRALDRYLEDIESYINLFSQADEATHRMVSDILNRNYSMQYGRVGGDEGLMLESIFQGDRGQFEHVFFYSMDSHVTDEMWMRVCRDCKGLPTVKQLSTFYDEHILKQTDWLIHTLQDVIKYINVKYEVQDKLF